MRDGVFRWGKVAICRLAILAVGAVPRAAWSDALGCEAPSCSRRGDIDCDGVVSAGDLRLAIALLFCPGACPICENQDANGDRRLSAADVVGALRLVAGPGQPSPTPTPSPQPTPTPEIRISDIQALVFDATDQPGARCTTLGCHSGAAPAGALPLDAARAFDALVGVRPDNPAARSRGLLRVDPGNLANSFLWLKVTGQQGPGEGVRMPKGGPPLSDAKLDALRRWILAGAPR